MGTGSRAVEVLGDIQLRGQNATPRLVGGKGHTHASGAISIPIVRVLMTTPRSVRTSREPISGRSQRGLLLQAERHPNAVRRARPKDNGAAAAVQGQSGILRHSSRTTDQ